MEAFRAVLLRVDDYNAARIKMTAEMADTSNLAKTLVIKARDNPMISPWSPRALRVPSP